MTFTLSDIAKSACAGRNKHLIEGAKQKKSKYGNKRVELDGHVFDSKAESRRYVELRMLERTGGITDLQLQVNFTLSVCSYRADFCYYDKAGVYIVEDVKGFKTANYRLKKKLMKSERGIEIKEVKK